MRRTQRSQPGTDGGITELATVEDRFYQLLLNRLDRIEMSQEASSESRRRLHEKLDQTDRVLDRVSSRVEGLERSLTSISPTIQEFMTYKHQVIGAGRFGRALWWLGGLVLTAASAVVSYLYGRSTSP